jgi:hypothetical protein
MKGKEEHVVRQKNSVSSVHSRIQLERLSIRIQPERLSFRARRTHTHNEPFQRRMLLT